MKIKSGGGIESNKYVTTKSPKAEPISRKANPAGVAQQGAATQFRKEPLVQGKGYKPAPMPATGSRGSFNSATSGPGSGRTVYGKGSQSKTPEASEMPAGRSFDQGGRK